jgi:hypothetical protein
VQFVTRRDLGVELPVHQVALDDLAPLDVALGRIAIGAIWSWSPYSPPARGTLSSGRISP